MRRPDHAREVRNALVDARALCDRLGLIGIKGTWLRQTGGGVTVRCPMHDEKSPSCSVRAARDGTISVKCFGCQWAGDALSLIAAVNKLDVKREFKAVLRLGAEIGGLWEVVDEIDRGETAARPERVPTPPPPASLEPERDYPPQAEVERFWHQLTTTADEWEVADWLHARRLDPDAVDGRELARALSRDAEDLPKWAVCRGGTWADMGYRLIIPMFDAEGRMRSVRARRVVDGPKEDPKCRPPFGHKASGLVMADAFALSSIRGGRATERFVVCEGEPDWLTWATRTTDPNTGVFGIVTGSWTPELTKRLPKGATVIVRTDPDPAGEKYAREIADSLKGRCFVRRAA